MGRHVYGCRMHMLGVRVNPGLSHAVTRYSPLAVGVLYFISWIVASSNRFGDPRKVLLYLLFAAAIAISGRFPMSALGLLVAIPALQIVGIAFPPQNTTWPTYAAAAIIAFFVGLYAPGARRYVALPVGAVASTLIAYCIVTGGIFGRMIRALELAYGPHPLWAGFAGVSLAVFGLFAVGWLLGVAGASLTLRRTLQTTKTKLEATDFELRLSQVRENVARDVHDALAHSLAIVVAQAEGAIALQTTKPEVALHSLRNIANVGRGALVDVRRLVEKIQEREDGVGERPSISDITQLLHHLQSIGMNASVHVSGDPRKMGWFQELAVYRIVQESLTNALKHAGISADATVELVWMTDGLAVRVVSEKGTPLIPPREAGRGVGIEGMKERAQMAGGRLDAQNAPDGSFIVTAFIPSNHELPESRQVLSPGPAIAGGRGQN